MRFLCRRILELCQCRYFGSSPRLYAVVYPASAFRTRSLGADQTCDTGVTGVIGSNSLYWNHINRFQGIRRIELNWMAISIEVLERYIELWSTLLLTLLRSTMVFFPQSLFRQGFGGKVSFWSTLFGVITFGATLLLWRNQAGRRVFTPTYGVGMLGMLADYLIGLPSVVVGCLWGQETVIKDEEIVWKPFRTCTFQK